ncbi:MAG: hypothetical protein ACRDIF_00545 [Actinomycetota bacterium]
MAGEPAPMEALPKVLRTRWLQLRAWPAGATPLTNPVAVQAYAVAEAAQYLQVTLVVRPAFLPPIRLCHGGPAGPWEEAVAWGPCAAGERRVFWARRQDGGRWRGAQAGPPAEEAEAPDRYAAWFTAETPAETP